MNSPYDPRTEHGRAQLYASGHMGADLVRMLDELETAHFDGRAEKIGEYLGEAELDIDADVEEIENWLDKVPKELHDEFRLILKYLVEKVKFTNEQIHLAMGKLDDK